MRKLMLLVVGCCLAVALVVVSRGVSSVEADDGIDQITTTRNELQPNINVLSDGEEDQLDDLITKTILGGGSAEEVRQIVIDFKSDKLGPAYNGVVHVTIKGSLDYPIGTGDDVPIDQALQKIDAISGISTSTD